MAGCHGTSLPKDAVWGHRATSACPRVLPRVLVREWGRISGVQLSPIPTPGSMWSHQHGLKRCRCWGLGCLLPQWPLSRAREAVPEGCPRCHTRPRDTSSPHHRDEKRRGRDKRLPGTFASAVRGQLEGCWMPCGWKYSSQRLDTPARTLLVLLQQKMEKKKELSSPWTKPTTDFHHLMA